MAWIESHQELANHPKTKRLSRTLGISTAQAIGHLHLLWWWALDYAQDGDLSGFSNEDIADACQWDGDPAALCEELMDVGFLDIDEHLHDWDQYGGKFIKERERGRERQRKHRASLTHDKQGRNAEVTRDSGGSSRVENSTEEKSREENQTKAPAAPVRVKYSVGFNDWWAAYPTGHGNKQQSYKQWKALGLDAEHGGALLRIEVWHGLELWKACDRWQRGMVKAAETWLKDRWWENTPPPPDTPSPSNGHKPEERRPRVPRFESMDLYKTRGGG